MPVDRAQYKREARRRLRESGLCVGSLNGSHGAASHGQYCADCAALRVQRSRARYARRREAQVCTNVAAHGKVTRGSLCEACHADHLLRFRRSRVKPSCMVSSSHGVAVRDARCESCAAKREQVAARLAARRSSQVKRPAQRREQAPCKAQRGGNVDMAGLWAALGERRRIVLPTTQPDIAD